MQSDISRNIKNIWKKNSTSDRGDVVWLQNFHEDLLLLSFSKKISSTTASTWSNITPSISRPNEFFKKCIEKNSLYIKQFIAIELS